MRGLFRSRRTLAVFGVAIAAVTVAGAVFQFHAHSASAAAPYISHPISVHPQYIHETAVNATVFGCQTRATNRCYGPQQIRTAYDIQPLLNQGIDGTGHTIVIVDAFQSPTIQHDLQLFDSTFGLPDPTLNIIAPDGLTPFDNTDGNQVGWSAEISLDVEWAHAVAPGATIDLVLAKSNQDADILSVTQYAINNNLGEVISQSFGEGESCVDPNLMKAEHAAFQAANAKGITLIASAGDQGSAQPTCDGSSFFLSASSPASDPLVLSIGGTQLHATPVVLSTTTPHTILDTGGAYQSENEWNDGSPGVNGDAGGGGFSHIYSRPSYQAPFGVPNGTRGVPDVAYNGAVDGGVLGAWSVLIPNAFFRFGGTSAGSPQWAGITVLANQMAGHRIGFLQDALYHIGKKPAQSSDFHDLTVGNNTFFAYAADSNGNPLDIQGFDAAPGWDADGGLGSPDVAKLVTDLVNTHVGNGGTNL